MCLAIVNIKGSIPKQALLNGLESNPDGMGLLYVSGGQLKDYKELQDFNLFYKFYINLKTRNRKPILIHFRFATQGKKDISNVHPFYVNKNLGFIHNGIIRGVGYDENKSDTVLFNEKILRGLPDNFLSNNRIVKSIEESIGNSKLAFLDNKGGVKIINEQMGHWYEGNWYSNNSYRNTISYSNIPFYHNPVREASYIEPRRKDENTYINPFFWDDNDNEIEYNEGVCLNCGSKHAEYDADIDCYICDNCRRTLF